MSLLTKVKMNEWKDGTFELTIVFDCGRFEKVLFKPEDNTSVVAQSLIILAEKVKNDHAFKVETSRELTIYTHDGKPPHQVAIIADDSGERGSFASVDREQYLKNKYGLSASLYSPKVPFIEWPPSDLLKYVNNG